ncbi:hypothetical protein [Streptomyces griseus]|uniref:hypothetical protein n=1 Tax=Streptomyces griseus TaxID=1911 RepID=UPI0033B2A981
MRHYGSVLVDEVDEPRPIREQAAMTLDLSGTYTYSTPGFPEPSETVTTRVSTRERNGMRMTSVRGLAPLLAGHIEAIADEGNRLHTLMELSTARIVISDTERDGPDSADTRDRGRLSTTYTGTADLPVTAVLDLAEQIRDQLAADRAAEETARSAEAARWDHLPWDIDHPDRELLDQAVEAGVPAGELVRIVGDHYLRYGHALRRTEELTIRRLVRERHDDLGLATDRQVELILSLLSERRRTGDGGGFQTGPVDRPGIEKLTREQASTYIDSLKGAY